MWDFISANAQVLTLCITAATLIVWTVYGQLMAKGLIAVSCRDCS